MSPANRKPTIFQGLLLWNFRGEYLGDHPRISRDTWWWRKPPFISEIEAIWKGSHWHNLILRGQQRSPWSLTTYPNWDDPPSTCLACLNRLYTSNLKPFGALPFADRRSRVVVLLKKAQLQTSVSKRVFLHARKPTYPTHTKGNLSSSTTLGEGDVMLVWGTIFPHGYILPPMFWGGDLLLKKTFPGSSLLRTL